MQGSVFANGVLADTPGATLLYCAPGGLTLNGENYIDIIDKTVHRFAAAGLKR